MSNTTIRTGNRWTNILINAIITITIGSVLVFIPKTIYLSIVIGIGVVLILSGISLLLYTYNSKQIIVKNKILWYLQSIINLTVGAFLVFQPELVLDFMIYFISVWLILVGVIQLFQAPSQKNIAGNISVILINSIISIVLGVAILIWPTFPLQFVGYIVMLIGIILLYYSFVFYTHRNDVINIPLENEDEFSQK
ncbi:MAG: hypothetical protein DRI86_15215 [Bacteroidetes bacterium]|nr:MAG: hypothetical protein DRI86_15215 [Bacteroidota bacterium]